MKALNIVEIEEKIVADLKNIRSADDLRTLQKWAKKAKKQKSVEATATSFKRLYYTFYTGRGYKEKLREVNYTSFVFLGLEIKLPDGKYGFPETKFTSHKIWIDRRIKYGGTEYFPKEPVFELGGLDLKELFLKYIIEQNFFVYEKESYKGVKTYYLLNADSNARKVQNGRRLTQFDTCNNPVVKIDKEHLPFLLEKITIKREYDVIDHKKNVEFINNIF